MSHFISCTAVPSNVLWLQKLQHLFSAFNHCKLSFPSYYAEALRQKLSSRLATKKTKNPKPRKPPPPSVLFYEGHLLNWHARATEFFLLFVSIDAATDESVGQYSSCTSKHVQLLAACFVNVLKRKLFTHSHGPVDGKQKKMTWPGPDNTIPKEWCRY